MSKIGEEYETTRQWIFAVRWRLGVGAYIMHEDEQVLRGGDVNNNLVHHVFEGLRILVPFLEIIVGWLYSPADAELD